MGTPRWMRDLAWFLLKNQFVPSAIVQDLSLSLGEGPLHLLSLVEYLTGSSGFR
jgi:hypothetical protein